ncbi:NAD-dependent epimerase/dehydratase family protein [Kitasatospora kifunensis]|uniref:Nucleoside-diphosphate-sugar epimerase n=1 Tax=Kitasatospora kifunensis TaxID=58351 RepID=A0A7W7QYF1_KITKI|nr:NAD-dependent epimerase/dehydratase family protein [Kitasatospora kifunensis]MBB4922120.1 nucleoside-diphosphate-sugar epimerase [Kitasatospora kifunensis]
MQVLVVGGTGFLGHHVVAELAARGHQATVLARTPSPHTVLAHTVLAHTVLGDARRLTEDEWAALLDGHQGVVFASGADDRTVPRRPAEPFFHEANVAPVRRLIAGARQAGCERAVVHGSYFTAIHRLRPELELARHHPYVRSRLAQARAARTAAQGRLSVAVLEIPFVFGATPGRRPLLAPAVPYLASRAPLLAPPGGTAVVTVGSVARSTVEALERGLDADLPVADGNLTWYQLLIRFAAAAGRPARIRVRTLPPTALHLALRGVGLGHRLRGLQGGLDSHRLARLLCSELYLEPTGEDDLDAALRETVQASLRTAPGA